jgi:hypothetical protein
MDSDYPRCGATGHLLTYLPTDLSGVLGIVVLAALRAAESQSRREFTVVESDIPLNP